jgi:hypothetical protein
MKIEQLGIRATFLIPSVKVYNKKYSKSGQSVAKAIHDFLKDNFGGYTCASGNIYGYFSSESLEYDELREFRVALDDDPHKRDLLVRFLAELAGDIGEECIYLECDNSAILIYP